MMPAFRLRFQWVAVKRDRANRSCRTCFYGIGNSGQARAWSLLGTVCGTILERHSCLMLHKMGL